MTERDKILGRIREALQTTAPLPGSHGEAHVHTSAESPAAQARDKAHRLALEQIAAADGPQAAEARSALATPAA